MMRFLSDEIGAGRTTFVIETALELLTSRRGVPRRQCEHLLTSVAAAIASDPVALAAGLALAQ